MRRWSVYPLLNALRCKSSTQERNAAVQVEWEPVPEDQQHPEVFGYYVLESLARRVTAPEIIAARNENLRHAWIRVDEESWVFQNFAAAGEKLERSQVTAAIRFTRYLAYPAMSVTGCLSSAVRVSLVPRVRTS